MTEVSKIEPRLKIHYETYVRPRLQKEFEFTNAHQVPRLLKIVLNVGVGEAGKDQKLLAYPNATRYPDYNRPASDNADGD